MGKGVVLAAGAAALLANVGIMAQANWASYGQDQGASRYSRLTQINAANVSKLQPAWTFHTGTKAANEATPVIVDSVMYVSASNGYFAVDAVTGTQIWKYEASDTTLRGVTYWPGDAKTPARIIGAVDGGRIVALDAKTGKPVPEFGNAGFADIGTRMTSPPAIYKDFLILPTMDKLVRAWNVRTGKLEWTFNLVPQPGEPGHDTWQSDAWKTTGGVNVWGFITVDPVLGMAYIPTAPPSPDYVGISRPGDTLYGTSLVALDANTGKLKWYHQLTHHDLWDFDSAAAPTLVEINQKGKKIPAVVHMGKMGLMFIFDRRDGTPIFGMEERPVPVSTVPGEKSSPTQPFPLKPEPIARISMKMEELPKNITPELASYCENLKEKYKLSDAVPYNPWKMDQDVVEFPGAVGGGNWNGTSYNPALGLVYTNVMNAGQWGHIGTRQARGFGPGGPGGRPGGGRGPGGAPGGGNAPGAAGAPAGTVSQNGITPGGSPQTAAAAAPGRDAAAPGVPAPQQRPGGGGGYRPDQEDPARASGPGANLAKITPEGGRFWQPTTRYSCAPPPWGELVAVNVNTGDIAWRSTLGAFDELEAKGLKTGTPNLGGGITTAGGLIFIGATVDGRFRAFDAKTGKELWSTKVDAPAHSIPATYLGEDGRQYVVVSAAGGGFLLDPTADSITAFALPAAKKLRFREMPGTAFPGTVLADSAPCTRILQIMRVHEIKTSAVKLVYEDSGPKNGKPLILVHGWPDSPRTFDKILSALHDAGYRTVVPYLRGYGPSSFRKHLFSRNTKHTGQPVAFAQDIIDLADALKFETFDYVGHDWGARTGYVLAALFPKRLKRHVAIAVPFEPGPAKPPKLPQAQAFWYQWFLCSIPGEKAFREDPVAYGKRQWDTWSPAGWYSTSDLKEAAKSWTGKDFADVVLHSYRSRWGHAEKDKDYAVLQARFEGTMTIGVPTLLLHGMEDHCELAETTDGAGRYFTGGYKRTLIEHVGHFPQRENPAFVADAILTFLRDSD